MPLLPIIIGIAGGLASAVVFFSASRGSVGLAVLLFLLTPLPTLIVGLGWGMAAAIAAGATGACVMAMGAGSAIGIGYFLALGLPVIMITHYMTLVRYGADGVIRSWFPAGDVLAAIALYGGALPVLVLPLIGGTYQVLEGDLANFIQRLSDRSPPDSGWRMTPDKMKQVVDFWVDFLPAGLASYWTLFFSLNTYIAARVTQASALLPRPPTRISRIVMPPAIVIAFLVAIVAVFFPGEPRVLGASFAGGLFVAFLIMGFTVAHAAGQTRASWVTPAAYMTAILANGIALPLMAGMGIAETAFRFRDRLMPEGAPPNKPPSPPPPPR